ncbi:MAG: glutamate synthase central domain-containing protein [Merdibacter sp.]
MLFHYFKQQFAQVTNPPIDSLWRRSSTYDGLSGRAGQPAEETDRNHALRGAKSDPDGRDMDKIRALKQPRFMWKRSPAVLSGPPQEALEMLFVARSG